MTPNSKPSTDCSRHTHTHWGRSLTCFQNTKFSAKKQALTHNILTLLLLSLIIMWLCDHILVIHWSAHTTNGWKKSQEQIPRSKFQLPTVTFHTPSFTSSTLLCSQSGSHLALSHFLPGSLVFFSLLRLPLPPSNFLFLSLPLLRPLLSILSSHDCQSPRCRNSPC